MPLALQARKMSTAMLCRAGTLEPFFRTLTVAMLSEKWTSILPLYLSAFELQ